MSIAIVWFRRDLRLADNPALRAALGGFDAIVPVYIHAPEEEGEWAPGGAQRWWLHHSLQALARALERAGTPLVVRPGPTRAALAQLIERTGAQAVLWNRLYEPAVVERDRAVARWLHDERGLIAGSYNAALLFEPWQVASGKGEPYRVFSPFWRALQRHGLAQRLQPRPRRLPAPRSLPAGERIEALGLLPGSHADADLGRHWQPGEDGAHHRLAWFIDEALADYDSDRERPAKDGTSGLSPWLHCGEIGPRQLVAAVQAAGLRGRKAAQGFLAELGWREFAHHLLYHFPATPTEPLDARFTRFPWRRCERDLAAWRCGRTGIPLVDAGMRQLRHCGWMHNRVRMVVTSFLTKNLRIHWLAGARWFWDTLVDADLASNTLGWQWSAGYGADAAPWFRIFNPVRQGERFDPEGEYVRQWVPELAALPAAHIHAPWRAPQDLLAQAGIELGHDYPAPIVDLGASREQALAAFESLRGRASS